VKPLRSLISLEEASKRVDEAIHPLDGVEEVELDLSLNRVLAEDVVSPLDIPPYSRAAMDGYALIAEDTFQAGKFSPVSLECTDVIHAGQVPRTKVERGKCIQIATGAMLPEGADSVIKVENTDREGDKVLIFGPVYPSAHVSKQGEDVKSGATVLHQGDYLVPSRVGALAAIGRERVKVFTRPRVTVIPTGDEVAPVGSKIKEGQVFDINSHTLYSILAENGCEPIIHPIVGDNIHSLTKILEESMLNSDMIVMSGGSSAGDRDVLEDVIADLGEVIFHGVQIKPGKPTIFGRLGEVPIFGMPGYPTSCLTNGYIFLVDAVRKMARLPAKRYEAVEVPLGKKITAQLGRHMFLTVVIRDGEAFPVFKESGTITSMAYADGWIQIPPNVDLLDKGALVKVYIFQ
jgi:molybdopterin molybdotransferase